MASSLPLTPNNPKAEVLNSWKEIATYMGRGVRTVQRYERNLHLPVRRVSSKSHGAVIAFPSDIDNWLRCVSLGESHDFSQKVNSTSSIVVALRGEIIASANLRKQSSELRAAHAKAVEKLVANLESLCRKSKVSGPKLVAPPHEHIKVRNGISKIESGSLARNLSFV